MESVSSNGEYRLKDSMLAKIVGRFISGRHKCAPLHPKENEDNQRTK